MSVFRVGVHGLSDNIKWDKTFQLKVYRRADCWFLKKCAKEVTDNFFTLPMCMWFLKV